MKNSNVIFKQGSKTFHTASMFFPKDVRSDVTRLYAYVRTADDFVDQIPQNKKGFMNFREQTEKAFKKKSVGNEIIKDFVVLSHEKNLEKKWIDAFLDAMEQDLTKKVYATFSELENYMYGSAEVIGLMMARIMQLPHKAERAARLQGKALQLINFIRDIQEDIELGRQYIPQEDLKRFGIRKIDTRVDAEAFKKLVDFELQRFREIQQEALKGYTYIPRSSRIPILTAANLYAWTAGQIAKNPMIVFDKKVKPSKMRIIAEYTKLTLTL